MVNQQTPDDMILNAQEMARNLCALLEQATEATEAAANAAADVAFTRPRNSGARLHAIVARQGAKRTREALDAATNAYSALSVAVIVEKR